MAGSDRRASFTNTRRGCARPPKVVAIFEASAQKHFRSPRAKGSLDQFVDGRATLGGKGRTGLAGINFGCLGVFRAPAKKGAPTEAIARVLSATPKEARCQRFGEDFFWRKECNGASAEASVLAGGVAAGELVRRISTDQISKAEGV